MSAAETALLLVEVVLHLPAVGVVITHHVKMIDETGTMNDVIETAIANGSVTVTGPAAPKTGSESRKRIVSELMIETAARTTMKMAPMAMRGSVRRLDFLNTKVLIHPLLTL